MTPSADLGTRLLARIDLTSEGDGLDHYGHGTHMAGLIAGNGSLAGGAYPGAAPEAGLVSVKVAGWDGATDVSTVIAGLQWAVSNRARYGLRVVNLSYGTDGVQETDRDPLDFAVEQAWRAGLVVVVSAGNGAGAVSKPGDDPFVITVGAADINGTATVGRRRRRGVLEPQRRQARPGRARRLPRLAARPGLGHRRLQPRRAAGRRVLQGLRHVAGGGRRLGRGRPHGRRSTHR